MLTVMRTAKYCGGIRGRRGEHVFLQMKVSVTVLMRCPCFSSLYRTFLDRLWFVRVFQMLRLRHPVRRVRPSRHSPPKPHHVRQYRPLSRLPLRGLPPPHLLPFLRPLRPHVCLPLLPAHRKHTRCLEHLKLQVRTSVHPNRKINPAGLRLYSAMRLSHLFLPLWNSWRKENRLWRRERACMSWIHSLK